MDSAFTTNILIQYTRARRAATARAAAMREPRRNKAARDAHTVALGCRGRVGRGPHVSETPTSVTGARARGRTCGMRGMRANRHAASHGFTLYSPLYARN